MAVWPHQISYVSPFYTIKAGGKGRDGLFVWHTGIRGLMPAFNDPDKYPLQLILRNMLDGSIAGMDEEFAKYVELIKYALIVISTVPILVLYPFLVTIQDTP